LGGTFFKVWWWMQGTTMSTTTLRLHFFKDSNQILYEIYVSIENRKWHICYIMCHVFGIFLEIFYVSFTYIDNLTMIYKSTFIFLDPYIITFGLHFPFDDTLKYPYFTS
jgi:hypothetical protein